MKKYDVVIIGSGPAGISAQIWAKRLGMSSLLLERNKEPGGQLHEIYNPIVDYPGFFPGEEAGSLSGNQELIRQFKMHLHKLNCECKTSCSVEKIDLDQRIVIAECGKFSFEYVIMATGARERRLGIPGEKEMIERGEVYSTSGELHHLRGKKVAIVGGGDRAFEGAIRVAAVSDQVHLFHRRDSFKARREFTEPALNHPHITVHTHCTVSKILGDHKVTAIEYTDLEGNVHRMETDVVLIRIGVQPNTELLHQQIAMNGGYFVTDEHGRTSHPRVFAVGDVATIPEFTSIASSVGQGMVAAKTIAMLLHAEGRID